MSTAPKKQANKSSEKPLTKNQRKKLKKKLKKLQQKEREGEGEEEGGKGMEHTENGELHSIPSPMATDSCELSHVPVAPSNSGGVADSGGVVLVNGGNRDHVEAGGGKGGGDGERGESVSGEESEGERGERDEDELKMKQWGPLKGPVQVKIADLGNACWVVSLQSVFYQEIMQFIKTTMFCCVWDENSLANTTSMWELAAWNNW